MLDQLILRQIQLQLAERVGIDVGDERLNQALEGIASDNGLTLEQLPHALAADGIDYAMFREETRDQMILDQLLQREVVARISISPRELDQCLARSIRVAGRGRRLQHLTHPDQRAHRRRLAKSSTPRAPSSTRY